MDFNLKQWREHQQQQHESEQEQQTPSAKLPRLLFDSNPQQQQQLQLQQQQQQQPLSGGVSSSAAALPLFVTEPTSKLSSNLSAYQPSPPHHSTPTATKYPRGMVGSSSNFSLAQWQELELQALIFRHMLAGAAVPPELLHLVKKSLINSSYHHHPYYLPHPLHHYPPHLQPAALLQSGYWGRGSMDPEPGRCRRTDGKKWRCSRDVVAGQKYCERHMHRGRNRSRKPVEIPSHATPSNNGGNVCGGILKTNNSSIPAHPLGALAGGGGGGGVGGGTTQFAFSGASPSVDLLHLSQRPSESIIETQNEVHGDDKSSGQTLRHFFDDWPRSFQESEIKAGNHARSVTSTTNLSISVSSGGHHNGSDFSLKLSTGDDGDHETAGNMYRERTQQPNWGTWGANQVASVGGPLAEALRSSTSTSSPTSVLHQLHRGSASDTSYFSP
ncbi:hypothetical protein ACH5RR_005580 [Cinchona calisaya]|uniref:Growth-regulating factor n=1 Tax=Cinchona calisaya TaxID=153742 RepID=A0ABD3ALL1_9GENT